MSAGTKMLRLRIAARLDRSDRYPRWALLVILTGLLAVTFPITVLTLAIPTMADDLGTDQAALAWVITLPILLSALALPALGKLGDLYGHRRVFIIGFSCAAAATAMTATAGDPAELIAWRTLSQVMGGATMPSSLALINSVHQGPARARAMGWWSMVTAGGPVLGLTVGAPVIDAIGWQALFLIQAALMVVPVAASWLILRETPRQRARFDVAGAVTLSLGVGPVLLAVDQAPEWGFSSPLVAVCAAAAVLGFVLFHFAEQRAVAPLLPRAVLRSRNAISSISGSFFTSASYMGGFFLASLLLVEQFGYSATAAVPILAIRPILFAASSPVGGWLAGRAGTRVGAVAGCVALATGLTGLAAGAAATSLAVVIGAGFLLQGIGYGLLRPALTTALADAVDQTNLGVAGAAERLAGQVGVAFGIATLATIYGGETDRFAPAFVVGALFGLMGLLMALTMRRAAPTG